MPVSGKTMPQADTSSDARLSSGRKRWLVWKVVQDYTHLKIVKTQTEIVTVVIVTLGSERNKNSLILATAYRIGQVPFYYPV